MKSVHHRFLFLCLVTIEWTETRDLRRNWTLHFSDLTLTHPWTTPVHMLPPSGALPPRTKRLLLVYLFTHIRFDRHQDGIAGAGHATRLDTALAALRTARASIWNDKNISRLSA